jgi:uncharacterized protein
MSAADTPKPWYRELWPWLLMLPPAASVIAGLGLAYLAVHEASPLVVDDYANIEQIAREESDADRRAGELALEATLTLRADRTGGVSIAAELPRTSNVALPATLVLRLRHVANPAVDRTLELSYDGSAYRGRVTLAGGRYDFDLGPADRSWRLAGAVGSAPTRVHVAAAPPEE